MINIFSQAKLLVDFVTAILQALSSAHLDFPSMRKFSDYGLENLFVTLGLSKK